MGGKEERTAVEEAGGKQAGEDCSAPEPSAILAPWLVKRRRYSYNEEGMEKNVFFDVFKPNNETCTDNIPELSGTTIYQKPSHQGWLIILCDDEDYDYTPSSRSYGDCFLWNPVTKERLQLPTLLDFCDDYGFIDCVLSSPPCMTDTNNPHNDYNNDPLVLVLLYNGNQQHLYSFIFCRPGETQWRLHKFSPEIAGLVPRRNMPNSLLCFKGKLYLLWEYSDHVDEHHLEIERFSNDTDLDISIKSFHVKKEALFPLTGKASLDSHFVESHDELFKVDVARWRIGWEVISVEVARLNFSSMEWEKVNSLGDHVLFFGPEHTTACCSAAESGFTSGCLYYLLEYNKSLHKFEIETTCDTITLSCLWPAEEYYYSDWVTMPVSVQGGVKIILGDKDVENGFPTTLEIDASTTTTVYDEIQGRNWNAGEVEVASFWSNLNEDTLESIANYLHGSDYKHFRSVCKANRELIPKVQKKSYLSPWLMFSRDHNSTSFNVVNPMYSDENYSISLSKLAEYTIRLQKGGWLLMTRNHNILFYNPFTRETVKLPDMDRDYYYSVVCFSSLPTSSDCIVFAMDRKRGYNIDFIRRGEAHWSCHFFDNTYSRKNALFLESAFFHDGAFFCVDTFHGTVGVFSVKDSSWKVLEEPFEEYFGGCSPGYLVQYGGDLLVVKLEYLGKPTKIFRLDFAEMKWVKVKSLGDHVLFISHTSCISTVAPDSYMKNKIYFPRLFLNNGGIVCYSLETRSYHSLGSEHSAKELSDTEGWLSNCTWIEPNRSMSTVEELDWLKT